MTTQTQPTVVLSKQVNASPQQVFDAWVKPELRRQWWRAAPEMSCTLCEIDGRLGGAYRLGMLKPAGSGPDAGEQDVEYIVEGVFTEFEPPQRLAFTWSWTQPSDGATGTLVTVDFLAQDRGTLVTVTHERLPSTKSADNHRGGWTGCLEQMALFFAHDS